jgi:exoribonuclease R
MPRVVRLRDDAVAAFAAGLEQIRVQDRVPPMFPPEVLQAAEQAAARPPSNDHRDRTDIPFVTLDPEASTDLDQAFAIERDRHDLRLFYAIADVPWFVRPGDPLDVEAWSRGVTVYLPDGRAPLYPPALSEGAASLLADGDRPAVVFSVRVDGDGEATLDHVERCLIRSRAKLGYETASAADLPEHFDEFAARVQSAEDERGAARVDTPQQEVEPEGGGLFSLVFKPRLSNEDSNAAMSLATNLAVAGVLLRARTGLFRVLAEPDDGAVRHLRFVAKALDLDWPPEMELKTLERTLHDNDPKHAAFMMAVRRSIGGATYAPFEDGVTPWHSAMAATYCHVTAPLRRLGDRYVLEAILAVVNGDKVPDHCVDAFQRLPETMNKAGNRAAAVERDAIDLVEAVVLRGREGQLFDAVVTNRDDRGVQMQLVDPIVVARVNAHHVEPGDDIRVRLISVEPEARQVHFERVG